MLSLTASCGSAIAGPPFRTDDPEPVEPGHWEIYEFSAATHIVGDTAEIFSGIDANYGAAPELQLHAAVPIACDKPSGNGMVVGYGDTEFGFKYRFLTADEHSWWPEAAIYPAVDFPTGIAANSLGTGRTRAVLPFCYKRALAIGRVLQGRAIGSILAPAITTSGILAGPCSVRSQRTCQSAVKSSTRRPTR